MHYQSTHIPQPLMFRFLRGQLVAVRQAMAADTLLLAELLCRLSERALPPLYEFATLFCGCDLERSRADDPRTSP
jgi:hypothetical protein